MQKMGHLILPKTGHLSVPLTRGGALGESLAHRNVDDRWRKRTAAIALHPAIVRIRGFLQRHQVVGAQHPGGTPVVPDPGFALFICRGQRAHQGVAIVGTEVGKVRVESVGRQLVCVHKLAEPADHTVMETTLGRLFGVPEHPGIARQLSDGLQVRRHPRDAAPGVTLNDVARNQERVLDATHGQTKVQHPSGGFRFLEYGGRRVGPDLHVDVDVAPNQSLHHRSRHARNVGVVTSETGLQNCPRDVIVQLRAVPVRAGKHNLPPDRVAIGDACPVFLFLRGFGSGSLDSQQHCQKSKQPSDACVSAARGHGF